MKTIVALVTLGCLTAPALAGTKPRTAPVTAKKAVVEAKPVVTKATKELAATLEELDYGETFVLGSRRSEEPTLDAETFEATRLKDAQAAVVIKERASELEYCWLRLPASKRVASSALIHFSIEATGAVAGIDVEGTLPAGVASCIEKLATKWTFPAADAGCTVEHPLMLGVTSDTIR